MQVRVCFQQKVTDRAIKWRKHVVPIASLKEFFLVNQAYKSSLYRLGLL